MSDLIRFSGQCEIEAAIGDLRPTRLSILAYSGDVMNVDGFGAVVVSLDGMDLPGSIPILSDHDNRLASVVASGTPRVQRGTLGIIATLADSDAARSVVSLLSSGVALQASIGAQPIARKFISAGEKIRANGRDVVSPPGGMTLVERSTLREISITPVGADASTSVSLAASLSGANRMNETETAVANERQRVKSINTALGNIDSLPPEQRQRANELHASALDGAIDLPTFQSGLLGLLRASRATMPAITFSGSRSFADPRSTLSAALMVRAGYSAAAEKEFGSDVMQASRPLQGASLVDLCRAALTADGIAVPSSRNEMIRAAVSTGSLTYALGDSANKIVSAAYRLAPAAWRSFASIKSCKDFKTNRSIRPSFPSDLAELPPGGEIKHSTFSEETFTWTLKTFARQLQIDRTQIVNDDLSVFSEVLPSLAKSASRTLSGLVATTILANASDFWGSANVNYFEGAATNLQASSLATAIKTLRQMKDAEGNLLDLMPAVLLVPPELEQIAKALVASADMQRYVTSGTDQVPMGNPFLNVATVVVEPRLSDTSFTGYSATAWYLFSEPSNAAVVVGFLDNQESPVIEQFGLDHDIDRLSVGFRVYHDFACALGDFRASVKSKGAA